MKVFLVGASNKGKIDVTSIPKFANSSQQQSGSGFSDIFPVVKQVDNISTISQDHLTSTSSPATHLNVLRYHQHLPGYLTHYTLQNIPTRQFYRMSQLLEF